jgi:hypothetical protein
MTIYIGVDPGLSGGMAILARTGAKVFDLPTVDIAGGGTIRRRLHGPSLYSILMREAAGEQCLVAVEALAAGGRAGFNMAQTQNAMYRARGVLETVFELAGLQVLEVTPKAWKGMYGLAGKSEDGQAVAKALQLAAQFYPELMGDLDRKKDHNRAEAVLIAHWLRRKHQLAEDSRQRAAESVL